MTPEIHKGYNKLKLTTDALCGILAIVDEGELLEWEKKARRWADGSLGIVAMACNVGMRDVEATEKNLTHAIQVSETLRLLKSLLIRS